MYGSRGLGYYDNTPIEQDQEQEFDNQFENYFGSEEMRGGTMNANKRQGVNPPYGEYGSVEGETQDIGDSRKQQGKMF